MHKHKLRVTTDNRPKTLHDNLFLPEFIFFGCDECRTVFWANSQDVRDHVSGKNKRRLSTNKTFIYRDEENNEWHLIYTLIN